jgi:hypothetical protein
MEWPTRRRLRRLFRRGTGTPRLGVAPRLEGAFAAAANSGGVRDRAALLLRALSQDRRLSVLRLVERASPRRRAAVNMWRECDTSAQGSGNAVVVSASYRNQFELDSAHLGVKPL